MSVAEDQMVVVVGKLRARTGEEETVAKAAERIIAETASEQGVIEYSFFQDPDDQASFTILEVWESAALLAAHSASEHLAEFRATVYPVLEARDVKVFDATLRAPK